MRIPKKLGLAGTLVAGGVSLAGCKTTIPEQTNPANDIVKQYNQVMTNVIYDQNKKIYEIGESAKEGNTKRLNAQREEDIKPIGEAVKLREEFLKKKAEFDKLCNNVIFNSVATNSSSTPSRNSLLVPNQTTTKKENTTVQAYLSSEERTDRDDYHFCGGGIEITKDSDRKLRGYAGLSTGNLYKETVSPTVFTTSQGNNLEFYGGMAGNILKIGKFEINLGLGGKFRFEEKTIRTSDSSGDNTSKDTTSIPGTEGKVVMKIGNFFIERSATKYFFGEGQHDGLTNRVWKAGFGFNW
jgi:hypothetical protein